MTAPTTRIPPVDFIVLDALGLFLPDQVDLSRPVPFQIPCADYYQDATVARELNNVKPHLLFRLLLHAGRHVMPRDSFACIQRSCCTPFP
eukprot:1008620-Prorocentrum_lima.AAC.1